MLKFLDKKVAKEQFIKCEYLKKIGSQEINVRTTRYLETAISRVELLENYIQSIISFSHEEKFYIEKIHKKAILLLCDYLPDLKHGDYMFIKVHGTLDWYSSFIISENCIIFPFKLFPLSFLKSLPTINKHIARACVYQPCQQAPSPAQSVGHNLQAPHFFVKIYL